MTKPELNQDQITDLISNLELVYNQEPGLNQNQIGTKPEAKPGLKRTQKGTRKTWTKLDLNRLNRLNQRLH